MTNSSEAFDPVICRPGSALPAVGRSGLAASQIFAYPSSSSLPLFSVNELRHLNKYKLI